jgi:hypothetical protein
MRKRESTMYAIEFETDITSKFIELQDYEKLINKHVRIIVLVEETTSPALITKNKVELFKELIEIRKNFPTLASDINIDQICNEVNSDIF